MYQIKYNYRTGDSFSTSDKEATLEYEWKDLDVAKESLRRIEEHYKWYESIEQLFSEKTNKPEWHNVNANGVTEDMEHYLINIPADNGKEYQFWAPWCGYFETLYGAEIVIGGKDMKIEI